MVSAVCCWMPAWEGLCVLHLDIFRPGCPVADFILKYYFKFFCLGEGHLPEMCSVWEEGSPHHFPSFTNSISWFCFALFFKCLEGLCSCVLFFWLRSFSLLCFFFASKKFLIFKGFMTREGFFKVLKIYLSAFFRTCEAAIYWIRLMDHQS